MRLKELNNSWRWVEPRVKHVGADHGRRTLQMPEIDADRLEKSAPVKGPGSQIAFPASRAARGTSTRIRSNSPAAKKTTCETMPS